MRALHRKLVRDLAHVRSQAIAIALVLAAGIAMYVAYYSTFDSPNGWGLYEHFVPFVAKYLAACIANPTATVRASR